MDVNGGIDSKRLLEQAGNRQTRVLIVPKAGTCRTHAGHHVYLDNAPQFNKIMLQFLQP